MAESRDDSYYDSMWMHRYDNGIKYKWRRRYYYMSSTATASSYGDYPEKKD